MSDLLKAINENEIEKVKKILVQKSEDPSAKNNQAIILAASKGFVDQGNRILIC